MTFRIYDLILEDYKAREIAVGMTEQAAAMEYFRGCAMAEEPEHEDVTRLPRYSQYIGAIEHTSFDLYHDFGACYYFIIEKTHDYAFNN